MFLTNVSRMRACCDGRPGRGTPSHPKPSLTVLVVCEGSCLSYRSWDDRSIGRYLPFARLRTVKEFQEWVCLGRLARDVGPRWVTQKNSQTIDRRGDCG